uniref:Uncharacterized protein n=1 Tax=Cacopsylla melanoneura TaxID=428564 RepID=A0A8D9B2F7_9HEMI
MAEDGSVCSSGSGESLSAGQLDSGKPLSGELVIGKPLSGQLVSGKPLSGEFVSGKPVSGEPVYRLLEQVLQSLLEEGALDDGGEGGRVVDWKHPEELKVAAYQTCTRSPWLNIVWTPRQRERDCLICRLSACSPQKIVTTPY